MATVMRDVTGRGMGCVDPKLLLLGGAGGIGPMLLSGGRLTTEQQGDIYL